MCDFTKGFKLCTCNNPKTIVHNKNSRRYKRQNRGKTEYIWQLSHHVGEQTAMIVGMYIMPKSDIGHGLTNDFVLKQLNLTNVFDFEIQPVEGDALFIQEKDNFENHLAFIYKNGLWVIDHYSPFSDVTELYLKGKIKLSE